MNALPGEPGSVVSPCRPARRCALGGGGGAEGDLGAGARLEVVGFNRFAAFDASDGEAVQDAARLHVRHRERGRYAAPAVQVVDRDLVGEPDPDPGEAAAAQV